MRFSNGITEEKILIWIAICIILAFIGLWIKISVKEERVREILKKNRFRYR